jgi:hypothetical protein
LCKNPILQALFQKREGSKAGSRSVPPMDPDPGGPKTYGYPTLNRTVLNNRHDVEKTNKMSNKYAVYDNITIP